MKLPSMTPTTETKKMFEFSPVILVITRDEIASKDTSSALNVLSHCIASADLARDMHGKLDICFSGYDDDSREVFEIEEIRDFVQLLDLEFPYWLYFMDRSAEGLYAVTMCFLPPFLTKEARENIYPERLASLLTSRWFPAMNYLCANTGFSEKQIDDLTDEIMTYYFKGYESVS